MKARADAAKKSRARKTALTPAARADDGTDGDDNAEVELTVFHVNHILNVSFSCFIYVEGAPPVKKNTVERHLQRQRQRPRQDQISGRRACR